LPTIVAAPLVCPEIVDSVLELCNKASCAYNQHTINFRDDNIPFCPKPILLIVEIAHTLMCMQCSLIKMPLVADLTAENTEVGNNSEEID
jgi:hypothetical protein